jgi:hypothetical protein
LQIASASVTDAFGKNLFTCGSTGEGVERVKDKMNLPFTVRYFATNECKSQTDPLPGELAGLRPS